MTPRHYTFERTWRVPAPRHLVFDALADLEHYPRWWPQVRRVVGIDEDTARVAVRSFLPYTLHVTLHRARADSASGHLLAEIAGDLEGWASVRTRVDGDATSVHYVQEVVTAQHWMNVAGPFLSPAFRLNHSLMMRDGIAGLTRYLASLHDLAVA